MVVLVHLLQLHVLVKFDIHVLQLNFLPNLLLDHNLILLVKNFKLLLLRLVERQLLIESNLQPLKVLFQSLNLLLQVDLVLLRVLRILRANRRIMAVNQPSIRRIFVRLKYPPPDLLQNHILFKEEALQNDLLKPLGGVRDLLVHRVLQI